MACELEEMVHAMSINILGILKLQGYLSSSIYYGEFAQSTTTMHAFQISTAAKLVIAVTVLWLWLTWTLF